MAGLMGVPQVLTGGDRENGVKEAGQHLPHTRPTPENVAGRYARTLTISSYPIVSPLPTMIDWKTSSITQGFAWHLKTTLSALWNSTSSTAMALWYKESKRTVAQYAHKGARCSLRAACRSNRRSWPHCAFLLRRVESASSSNRRIKSITIAPLLRSSCCSAARTAWASVAFICHPLA